MQKLGFSLQSSYSLPMPDVLKLLHDVGFNAVSPGWQKGADLDEIMNSAAKYGLTLQSFHGPLRGLPGMWSHDPETAAPILLELLSSADICAAYDIPILVVHSWGGLQYTFREDDLCFDHFDRLLEHANRKGLRIAFENLEGPEYLDSLMARYTDPRQVGFCWDSGHEMCYTPQRDFLKAYGDRLLMTHLNDNYGITRPDGQPLGTDDLHLIPFDGIADWQENTSRLKQAKYQQILNFELKIRPKGDRCTTDLYSKTPLEQYFADAYERACRAVSGYFE